MYKWDYDANCEVARTFTYDANGMRVKRMEPDGTTYNYVYNGGLLSQMTVDNNTSSVTEYTLFFTYDAAGIPTSVTVNGTTYYYVTNLQGDVVAILDSHGGTVAKYVYDAWGNILDSSFFFRKYDPVTEKYGYNEDTSANAIGRLNPLRYRGYVYDTETGWYYLQSRYYNPEWGRFLTGDSQINNSLGILGINLFAYCLNNPINLIDKNGKSPTLLESWSKSMWWLCGADAALPVGEIIYVAGIVIFGVLALTVADEVATPQTFREEEKEETKTEPKIEPPDVTYPGNDPQKAPEGYEWRGPDEQGGKRGGYINPKGKDSWHPDLDHPKGVDPHWDYNDGYGHKWRVFPDDIKLVP